jgi:tRNA(fMet)-specific endonuclease VapC
VRRLALLAPTEQFTTTITYGELLYGARKRGSATIEQRVESLADAMTILPFDAPAASIYATLRADLEGRGRRLDEPDLRIASIVLNHGLTLVTGNVRHFARVEGLPIQNWLTTN